VEELWDEHVEDKREWLKRMATKENGVTTHTLIEHVCEMISDCGMLGEGSLADAVLEDISNMESDLACHLDRYIINDENVMLWEEVWDKYFPEEADETESDSEEECEGCGVKESEECKMDCSYQAKRRKEEILMRVKEREKEKEKENEGKGKCVCCNETVSDDE